MLQRNKDQEYNNLLASFATCLCRKRSELRTCAKRFGGLTVTTLPQARNQEGRSPPKNIFGPLGKCVGHSLKILDIVLKNWGPLKSTPCPTWYPNLVMGLLCPDRPRVHLSGIAYMPSCIRPEVRLPLYQRILCSDCRKV